ncbi:MAG: hypothetical protein R6X02_00055 [Enhygromyxa sp.]
MLLASVALRLLESSGTSWWLITVPDGCELAVASELREELEAQVDPVFTWPGPTPDAPPVVSLFVVTKDVLGQLPTQLEGARSRLAEHGVIAFILAESNAGTFLSTAPHVASFIGGKVLETSTDDAPPSEFIERRLASLRSTYALSDEQARAAFEQDQAPDPLDFLEWMVLLGAQQTASSDDG